MRTTVDYRAESSLKNSTQKLFSWRPCLHDNFQKNSRWFRPRRAVGFDRSDRIQLPVGVEIISNFFENFHADRVWVFFHTHSDFTVSDSEGGGRSAECRGKSERRRTTTAARRWTKGNVSRRRSKVGQFHHLNTRRNDADRFPSRSTWRFRINWDVFDPDGPVPFDPQLGSSAPIGSNCPSGVENIRDLNHVESGRTVRHFDGDPFGWIVEPAEMTGTSPLFSSWKFRGKIRDGSEPNPTARQRSKSSRVEFFLRNLHDKRYDVGVDTVGRFKYSYTYMHVFLISLYTIVFVFAFRVLLVVRACACLFPFRLHDIPRRLDRGGGGRYGDCTARGHTCCLGDCTARGHTCCLGDCTARGHTCCLGDCTARGHTCCPSVARMELTGIDPDGAGWIVAL